MQVHFNALAPQLQTLFTTAADRAAASAQLIRRRRKLTGPAFAQGLVFGWLDNPNASLDELVVALARAGVTLRQQSLEQRFTAAAADFFRRLLADALALTLHQAEPTALPLLGRFAGVFLLDSSLLPLPAALAELFPGCGGRNDPDSCRAALKITVRYELGAGRLEGLELNPGRLADAKTDLQTAALPAGALRLADLGFFDLDVLRSYDQQRVYFIEH